MGRSPIERMSDWLWWLEQVLHALGAWPAFFLPWWGGLGMLAGAGIGLYIQGRAEWEQRPVESWFDFAADLTFAAIGGALWVLAGKLLL